MQLAWNIYTRIAKAGGVTLDEAINYITGRGDSWDFKDLVAGNLEVSAEEWERDIASLDAAILSLLDASTADTSVEQSIDQALEGSLFTRQLAQEEGKIQGLIRGLVKLRAKRIWSQTQVSQRKGYHAAGIGLRAGQFLDSNLAILIEHLVLSETSVAGGDPLSSSQAIIHFAELVFQTPPFRPLEPLPSKWKHALKAWIEGQPAADVVRICGEDVDFLQDSLTYRLPWAMEAVRVHAAAVGHEGHDQLNGLAALAVEAGNVNRGVIVLLRNGLNSREAAIAAVTTTGAFFTDWIEMMLWLNSDEIRTRTNTDKGWPTIQSRHSWLQFYEGQRSGSRRPWLRSTRHLQVKWSGNAPSVGAHLIVKEDASGSGDVFTPNFNRVGKLLVGQQTSLKHVVSVRVSEEPNTIAIETYGPEPRIQRNVE